MGKTALVLNMAANAMFAGKNVAIFTLEMSKEQLMGRVLASVSKVDSSRFRKGDLSDEEQDRLMEGARRVYERKGRLSQLMKRQVFLLWSSGLDVGAITKSVVLTL